MLVDSNKGKVELLTKYAKQIRGNFFENRFIVLRNELKNALNGKGLMDVLQYSDTANEDEIYEPVSYGTSPTFVQLYSRNGNKLLGRTH